MELTRNMSRVLPALAPHFEKSMFKTLESMFSAKSYVSRKFRLTYPLRNNFGISCNMLLSNADFQANLSIGINPSDLIGLVGDNTRPLQIDALGELTNALAGAVQEEPIMIAEFGFMEQAPPLLIEGGFSIRKAHGLEGVILAGDARVYAGFTCWEKRKRPY